MQADLISGFGLGLGLIVAIGSQNAFVLRQGLLGRHVFAICLACALSDAALIAAGVAGIGALARALPWLEPAMRYGGAAFLAAYGALALRAAWRGQTALRAGRAGAGGLWAALATVLAFTWLNPHVYLDTLFLIGSVSSQAQSPAAFGAGAVAASFVFFFSLGYGARLLAPVFARPAAWRALDLAIAVIMWTIAINLLLM